MSSPPPSINRQVGQYLKLIGGHKRPLSRILLLYPIKHAAYLFYPILIKWIIDWFIPAKRLDLIFATILVVCVLGVVNYVCHRAYAVHETVITKSVSRDLRNQLIEKLQLLSLQYHLRQESGRFFSKLLVDVERTEKFAELFFNTFVASAITIVFSIVVLFHYSWKMLLFYLLCVPFYFLVYRYFNRRFGQLQKDARLANEDLSSSIQKFIQTSFLSRVHGEEEFERKRLDQRSVTILERQKSIRKTIAAFVILITTYSQGFTMLIVAACAYWVIAGQMTIGALVLFLTYISQVTNSITNILHQFPIVTEFAESMNSIQEVLGATDESPHPGTLRPQNIAGCLEFQEVRFAYPGGKPVFHKLSAKITAGSTVALVGASGAGKTTFVNLALGLMTPQSGRILLDGNDLVLLDMQHIRRQIGVVTQEPILFGGSVYENIAHARENFDPEEVHQAARRANADGFIQALPDGYHTLLGERGATLSGGQKQRIAIARTLFRKPSLLVLDEATSSLDPEAEREVQKGIEALLGNQTTLVIAHRLSTIFQADRILVFDGGNLVESGTHAELILRGGRYARLLQVQLGLGERGLLVLKETLG